jgi:hypothetical protein
MSKQPFSATDLTITDTRNASVSLTTGGLFTPFSTDGETYANALGNQLRAFWNSTDYIYALRDAFSVESTPHGCKPTALIRQTWSNRSVTVDMADKSNNKKPKKVELKAGSSVYINNVKSALLYSRVATIYDAEMVGNPVTKLSVLNAAESVAIETMADFSGKLADLLEKQSSMAKVNMGKKPATMTLQAESFEETFLGNFTSIFGIYGVSPADVAIMIDETLFNALGLIASRRGFKDSELGAADRVSQMLGVHSSWAYRATGGGATRTMAMVVPKNYASLSFRQDREGSIWSVIVSREPKRQATHIEVKTTVDVLANAFVKVDITTDSGTSVDTLAFPVVQAFSWES